MSQNQKSAIKLIVLFIVLLAAFAAVRYLCINLLRANGMLTSGWRFAVSALVGGGFGASFVLLYNRFVRFKTDDRAK